ncbi:class I SAM-dependent RNA methyltransferase [Paractinoplanes toevensis]|uniref:RNA methyltransferase n=1 Tax=Paractinoplanes toevensis TaxID=571911 RepID=A0A919THA1_9ACTN|nr:TRAM domain-containing protein [Actinoplanes toevensis]GIM94079.1 putative RNA methyltransferase [Actinoplanes toevensis]
MISDPSLDLVEGDRVELTVGAPAHGGHCVARRDNRVFFVRHALPGERVTAEITERHKGYLRADAVEILQPSPDRVKPPCPYAHPGGCGGCDLQHVAGDAQLRWKEDVVREQLRRLAGLTDFSVRVEPLPTATSPSRISGSVDGAAEGTGSAAPAPDGGRLLGWRSRVRYAVDAAGRPGLLQHRSHQVVPVDRCRIAHAAIQELDVLTHDWPDAGAIEATASTGGDVAVLIRPAGQGAVPADDPTDAAAHGGRVRVSGPAEVTEVAAGREWGVPPEGFWQVHPAAAETLTATVVELLRPAEGESAWDLYGGAGLFAAAVAERTGARTTLVESSPLGCAAARANLADLPTIEVVEARVETALQRRRVTGPVDLVVLDPPRAGAGARVVRGIADARPRAVAYVACDPAALARDVATFRDLGWQLTTLRAFDCFPMTQHVECVALFEPAE